MIVVLIGYMASGKSTIGIKLAQELGFAFLDLDQYIEQQENASIPHIFKNKGEIYFRKKEHYYLKELLNKPSNLVLSLGGGTPCYYNNMQLILEHKNINSFYLKASIPALVQRIKSETQQRPLVAHLKTDEQLTEFIGKHLFERAPFYVQANKTILTDNKPLETIINEITKALV